MYNHTETLSTQTTTDLKNNHNNNIGVISNIISNQQNNILFNAISSNKIKNPINMMIPQIAVNNDGFHVPCITNSSQKIIDYKSMNEFDLTVHAILYIQSNTYFLSVFFDDTLYNTYPLDAFSESLIDSLSNNIMFSEVDVLSSTCTLYICYSIDNTLKFKEYIIDASSTMTITIGTPNTTTEINTDKYNQFRFYRYEDTIYFISNYDSEFKYVLGNISNSATEMQIKDINIDGQYFPIDNIGNLFVTSDKILVYNIFFINTLRIYTNYYIKSTLESTLVYEDYYFDDLPNHTNIDIDLLNINILNIINQTDSLIEFILEFILIENFNIKRIKITNRVFETSKIYFEKNIINVDSEYYLHNIVNIYGNIININNVKNNKHYFINNTFFLIFNQNIYLNFTYLLGYYTFQEIGNINIETPTGIYYVDENYTLKIIENNENNLESLIKNKNIKILGILYKSGDNFIFIDHLGV